MTGLAVLYLVFSSQVSEPALALEPLVENNGFDNINQLNLEVETDRPDICKNRQNKHARDHYEDRQEGVGCCAH